MTEPKACPYSGLSVVSCKVSDLCDCFDFPFAENAAAQIVARRDARQPEESQ